MIPKIKKLLSVHSELNSQMAGLPFGPPGGMPFAGGKTGSLVDYLQAALGGSYDGEEEEEDGDGGSGPYFGRKFGASRGPNRKSRTGRKSGS